MEGVGVSGDLLEVGKAVDVGGVKGRGSVTERTRTVERIVKTIKTVTIDSHTDPMTSSIMSAMQKSASASIATTNPKEPSKASEETQVTDVVDETPMDRRLAIVRKSWGIRNVAIMQGEWVSRGAALVTVLLFVVGEEE
ncbi:hypothetical protein HDV00_011220, partial [Rhizophlyctis rosea]